MSSFICYYDGPKCNNNIKFYINIEDSKRNLSIKPICSHCAKNYETKMNGNFRILNKDESIVVSVLFE